MKSCPTTGRRSSPQCQIQLMTQPRTEAVSWIYFGYWSSLLSTASSIVATRKGLLGSCTKLYFPCNPIAEPEQAFLAQDCVGTARTGHAGVWPRIGSAESRRPHKSSHIPSSPDWSHCTELANPNAAGIWASDEFTEPR